MLDYLVERENEQMLRTSKRSLKRADGGSLVLKTYRVVWTWYDRILISENSMDEGRIIEFALAWADEHSVDIDRAFAQLIQCIVKEHDVQHWDLTDDTIMLSEARRRMGVFDARKEKRQSQ